MTGWQTALSASMKSMPAAITIWPYQRRKHVSIRKRQRLSTTERPTLRRRSKLLAAFVLALVAMPVAGAAPVAADGPAPDERSARYEVHFMTNMIDHHHMAVMMSAVCVQKTDIEPELRAMCETMLDHQQDEMALMQSWLQDWYGISHPPMMMPGHGEMMAELAALDGDEFEIAFMRSMAGHHLDAVREANRCQRMASHQELLDLCAGIRDSQLREVEVMRSWLCEWHDICRPRQLRF